MKLNLQEKVRTTHRPSVHRECLQEEDPAEVAAVLQPEGKFSCDSLTAGIWTASYTG